uniref:Uncharacterized protein AlNc14C99G5971 n=1 Tax=Albugo laibachii Nc14 TaxID=890382 RepID=F0WHA5_9STRA|nr:conserved hypothetical protein [Albugo laibachii Nc14]|eukprot:CCA20621.1 conserved hypothetical protein [Albugo laibachii Nc14]
MHVLVVPNLPTRTYAEIKQVMSPTGSDSALDPTSYACDAIGTYAHASRAAADTKELREEAQSVSVDSEDQEKTSRTFNVSSESMDRLERHIPGMAQQQSLFMANQIENQGKLDRRTEDAPTPPSEHSFNGPSAFTDFIEARNRAMRMGSLYEPSYNDAPTVAPRMPLPNQLPQTTRERQPHNAQNFVLPENHGYKILKPRDLDWPTLERFSGKEAYPGVDADSKAKIIGKDDETKVFKVYLPKSTIFITTQHVRNIETLNSVQNVQLKNQLELEDPDLRRVSAGLDEAQKWKGPVRTEVIDKGSAWDLLSETNSFDICRKKEFVGSAGKKTVGDVKKEKKSAKHDDAELERTNGEIERLPEEKRGRTRIQTCNMGAKHVPVAIMSLTVFKDPKNFRETMKDPHAEQWRQAMCTEIAALEQNDTWEIIIKPQYAKLLHSKWVYKIKQHADGSIERYKARLVARGDEQIYGVDYTYTFSAVLEMISSKVILAVPRIWRVPTRHGDVPGAYVKVDKEAGLEILLHIPQEMELKDEQFKI